MVDGSNRLSSISISIKVPPEKIANFASSIGPGKGQSAGTFIIGGDRELYDLLVNELQALESHMAFNTGGAIKRIRWDKPIREEVIPENEEEEKLVPIIAISHNHEYPLKIARIHPLDLENMIKVFHKYDSLKVSIAFWREGVNFFENFQYILAFYYFYFILEDFYGGGKFHITEVLTEFNKSSEFTEITNQTLNAISKEKRHMENLERFLQEEKCDLNADGVQKLLFKIRGKLHHYYSGNPKKVGTPFNQSEYETIALIANTMAYVAIARKYPLINNKVTSQNGGKV